MLNNPSNPNDPAPPKPGQSAAQQAPPRVAAFSSVPDKPLDLLVIGGGIVGSGVARDAALRSLRTLLVEKSDFASGTSSRSSRLLHGGLRYLAQGRLGLVREASVEKVIIHTIAPHLAAPLPFIFPTRKNTEWKRWKLGIGVKLYDLLCSGRNFGKSQTLSREELLKLLPNLNDENLTGGVRYFDGFTNDARLVLDTLRSAAAAGATLLNYTSLERAERKDDLWHCTLRDRETNQTFEVKSKVVINAAGAWADQFPPSQVKLRLTKGVHVVIDRSRLPIPDAVVMPEGTRILFAIPWGERVILGTTDTDYAGPRDCPTTEPQDIDYILRVANETFPSAHLSNTDIISTYAGLRPLINNSGADKTGQPSDISRAHQIKMPQPGWIDVAGGKLTTYRLMAEQALDQAVDFAHLPAKPCITAHAPLLPQNAPEFSGILPPAVSQAAVEHFCRHEWSCHLEDVMIRRTSWRYYHRDHLAIAQQVAAWMASPLGWDAVRMEQELNGYQQTCAGARRDDDRDRNALTSTSRDQPQSPRTTAVA